MGKVKTYFQSDSTDDFEVVDGALFLDGIKVVGKDEMKEFRDWLAGEVGDSQEYDFDKMNFYIDEARKGNIFGAFSWFLHSFGSDWWLKNESTAEGRAELDKMIREYERIHGKDS